MKYIYLVFTSQILNNPFKKGPIFGERLEVNESNISEDNLWVNKYSPRRFTELTSSDQVNLEVLRWINQWKNINNRPEKTILLLSGPPGLGKTTLVQIAAQTAGFKVVEINARYAFRRKVTY